MDLATLLGLIGGFAFVIMAMVLGGSIGMYVDTTSILIVVGGSTFVVLMKFTVGQFLGAAKLRVRRLRLKPTSLKI
ncbi:flagellar motor rotation protein MotA [Vibrio ponticus]|nr:flagellar motor rotation protein MotA [Vibrio ponticus]